MRAIKLVSIIVIIVNLSQCKSVNIEKEPPFQLEESAYNNWVGGQPGIKGIQLVIALRENSTIAFDSVFFQKRATKVEISMVGEKMLLIGHFNTSNQLNSDLILDINVAKEIKNSVPELRKFPFQLKDNEAIISYRLGGKTNYFKIENIENSKPVFFQKQIKIKDSI